MRGRPTRLAVLLTAACLPALVGCSTFERDWRALETQPSPESGMEGRWQGTWLSDANGHSGGLRCILSTDDEGTLQARYRATYLGFMSFEYSVPMTARLEDEIHHFTGEADLGWLAGGRYVYVGTVEGDAFTSTYESEKDHGTFEMTRVSDPGRASPEPDDR